MWHESFICDLTHASTYWDYQQQHIQWIFVGAIKPSHVTWRMFAHTETKFSCSNTHNRCSPSVEQDVTWLIYRWHDSIVGNKNHSYVNWLIYARTETISGNTHNRYSASVGGTRRNRMVSTKRCLVTRVACRKFRVAHALWGEILRWLYVYMYTYVYACVYIYVYVCLCAMPKTPCVSRSSTPRVR